MFEQPCLKAYFVEIIKGGSCNYFSQRQIDHLTVDGQRRISKTLPEMIDFDKLLSLVGKLRNNFSIGAFSKAGSDPLWILDLSQMFKFLTNLGQRSNLKGDIDFRRFLDSNLTGAVGWEKCVKDLDTQSDLLVRVTQPSPSHETDRSNRQFCIAGIPSQVESALFSSQPTPQGSPNPST